MKKLKTAVLLLILCAGCAKEVQGPKGDPGPAGPQGAPGPAGSGGANMSTTGKILVPSTLWTLVDQEYYATIGTPVITQKVVDEGTVQVFVMIDSAWHNLPYLDHTLFINF